MIISIAPAGLEEMFFEFGVPLSEGSTSALPPTKDEIEKLLAIAPNYGIEIRVPHHDQGNVRRDQTCENQVINGTQETQLARENLRGLRTAVHLAKEVGEGLGQG
nr:hypothetical protein [Aporhodopirellula aestuarii]